MAAGRGERRGPDVEKTFRVLWDGEEHNSWKTSRWPKRLMEQVTEYNVLDFSRWEEEAMFEEMFTRLLDGLQLFYK